MTLNNDGGDRETGQGRVRLLEFVSDVVHRAGIKHQAVDALFRLRTGGSDNRPLGDQIPSFTVNTGKDVSHSTAED